MNKKTLMAMVYGLCVILSFVLISSLVLSLLLKFSDIQESSLTWIVIVISVISLFIGGFISGGKGEEKGWFSGGGTGLLFTIIVFFIQYLGYQISFSLEQLLFHLGYIFVAIIGGILGVNVVGRRRA